MNSRIDGPDGPGIRLAAALFVEVVAPILDRTMPDLRYDAGLIGAGSEVLGFDSDRSTDHDFGARCQLFVASSDDISAVAAILDVEVPASFRGFPTRFHRDGGDPGRRAGDDGPIQVIVTTAELWSRAALGIDATAPLAARDWLGIPTQLLAEATGGAVFHSGLGELTAMRSRLVFYPDDVWRYVLAGQWLRIGQEEPFVGRTGEVGDDLGSALLTGRLVRDLMRLAMLLRRRYPPYAKWLGSAYAQMADAGALTPMFTAAMRATGWREREEHLCRAYEFLGALQNDLGIAAPVEATRRGYYSRPFQVIGAERFTTALTGAITDPELTALPLIGSVDQVVDSTDVLSDPVRSRAVVRALLG